MLLAVLSRLAIVRGDGTDALRESSSVRVELGLKADPTTLSAVVSRVKLPDSARRAPEIQRRPRKTKV